VSVSESRNSSFTGQRVGGATAARGVTFATLQLSLPVEQRFIKLSTRTVDVRVA